MYSKEYDRNLEISKIHHKRKECANIENLDIKKCLGRYRWLNNWLRKISILGMVLIICVSVITIAEATETGTWQYGAALQVPPKKLLNNVWGAPYSEKQSGSLKSYIYYKSEGTLGWEWSRPNPVYIGSYIQPIYPEVLLGSGSGYLPKKLKDISSMSAELRYNYTKVPTGSYNLAYDIWITYGGTKKAEVMIWIGCSTTTDCAPGTYAGDVNDGYNTYSVYYRNPRSSAPWLYYAFILKNRSPTPLYHKVNIKALLNSMSSKLNGEWVVSSVEIGNEVWKGSGRIAISKWSFNATTGTSSSPYVAITSPNGGESFARGSTRAISWKSAGNVGGYVKIELYKGGIWQRTISSSTLNDGSFSWTVPWIQTGSDYKIKITTTNGYKDWSNNYFKIY